MSDFIRRSYVADKLTRIVNEMEEIFSNIRMKLVDDSVCGLCEYDCDHGIDGYANECPGFEKDDCFKLKDEYRKEWSSTKDLPSAEPNIKTLTPKEFVGEISPVSLYSANDWNNLTAWLYERGYVICRKENR